MISNENASYVNVGNSTRPRGRPPKGKVWSSKLGIYLGDDTPKSVRPRGRPPKGKIWSEKEGEYKEKEGNKTEN